jgi:hypothetical protein
VLLCREINGKVILVSQSKSIENSWVIGNPRVRLLAAKGLMSIIDFKQKHTHTRKKRIELGMF